MQLAEGSIKVYAISALLYEIHIPDKNGVCMLSDVRKDCMENADAMSRSPRVKVESNEI